jgi:hypothetical protein
MAVGGFHVPRTGLIGPGHDGQERGAFQRFNRSAEILAQHHQVTYPYFLGHVVRVDPEPPFQNLQRGAACDRMRIDRGTGLQCDERNAQIVGLRPGFQKFVALRTSCLIGPGISGMLV